MTEIAMRKEQGKLVPVDQVSDDELALIPNGTDCLVTPKFPRNLQQFRLAWALADKVAESCQWLADREDAMHMLKLKAKHVSVIALPSGAVELRPKSIAFASIGQATFARVFNRMVYVICSEIIPGLKESDLRREIEKMVGAEIPRTAVARTPTPRNGSNRGRVERLASPAPPAIGDDSGPQGSESLPEPEGK